VLDAGDGQEPAIVDAAAAAGIPERLVHVRGGLDAADRASVLDAAVVHLAPSRRSAFPWRVAEALVLGVPVVAVASGAHRDVIVDGGIVVGDPESDAHDRDALAEGLARALGSTEALDRLAVLAADRGRSFSWREAADRVWQLHADL
jgi:glycosyltransferase involved in cell wall biosynthesis